MLTEDKSLRLALVEMRAARRHARKALEHLVAATFVEDDPCRGLALVLMGWLCAADSLLERMPTAVDTAIEDLKQRTNVYERSP